MANDARIRQNNIQGTLSSTLTAAATTMVSAALANLQAITSTQHAAITIDPGRANGAPEIVYVTAHTAASTKATIARGKEGTAARTHPTALEAWLHAPSAFDYNQVKTSTSRPASPFAGQTIWERDKTALRIFDGSSWRRVTVSPPSARARRLASAQTINNSSWNALTFDTADWNTGGNTIFSTTSNAKFKIATAGKYLVAGSWTCSSSTAGKYRGIGVRLNTTAGIPKQGEVLFAPPKTAGNVSPVFSNLVSMTTGQFFQLVAFQDSGAGKTALASSENFPFCSVLWVST